MSMMSSDVVALAAVKDLDKSLMCRAGVSAALGILSDTPDLSADDEEPQFRLGATP